MYRTAIIVGVLALIALFSASDIPCPIIDYFYEAGCAECRQVNEQIIPALESKYDGAYDLRRHDVGVMSNMIMPITRALLSQRRDNK